MKIGKESIRKANSLKDFLESSHEVGAQGLAAEDPRAEPKSRPPRGTTPGENFIAHVLKIPEFRAICDRALQAQKIYMATYQRFCVRERHPLPATRREKNGTQPGLNAAGRSHGTR